MARILVVEDDPAIARGIVALLDASGHAADSARDGGEALLLAEYTPTFGKTVLKLTQSDALLVTLCVGISNLIWLPIMGALSDRVGRRPLLLIFASLAVASAYPAMLWLVGDPSFAKLMVVEMWLSFLYAGYNGAMVVHLTEIVPAAVRTAGFSLAYSLATTIGGSTPAIVTYLIHATGNRAMPGAWLSVAALLALLTVQLSRETKEPTKNLDNVLSTNR